MHDFAAVGVASLKPTSGGRPRALNTQRDGHQPRVPLLVPAVSIVSDSPSACLALGEVAVCESAKRAPARYRFAKGVIHNFRNKISNAVAL